MAESKKKSTAANAPKPARAKAKKTEAKRPARTSSAAPANNRTKKQEEPEVVVHKTSSQPSRQFTMPTMPSVSMESVKNTLRKRELWYWAGGITAAVLILLFSWWQWQRSYVGVVNGQYIQTSDLHDQMVANNGTQTLETLVQQQLIMQEAYKQNISVTDEEINAELATFVESTGGEDSYRSSLKQYGISEEILRNQIKVRKTLEKLLGERIDVSEEEIKAYYDANKEEVDVANEGLEGARERISIQLREQKLGQESGQYLESIQQTSTIQTNIDHASLSFGQFMRDEVLSIPTEVYNLFAGLSK